MEKRKVGRPLREGVKLVTFPIVLNPEKLEIFAALLDDGVTKSEGIRTLIDRDIEAKTGLQE